MSRLRARVRAAGLAALVRGGLAAGVAFLAPRPRVAPDWDSRNRAFADGGAGGETVRLVFTKTLADGGAGGEAVRLDFTKALADGGAGGEEFRRVVLFNRGFADGGAGGEAVRLGLVKPLADGGAGGDAVRLYVLPGDVLSAVPCSAHP